MKYYVPHKIHLHFALNGNINNSHQEESKIIAHAMKHKKNLSIRSGKKFKESL